MINAFRRLLPALCIALGDFDDDDDDERRRSSLPMLSLPDGTLAVQRDDKAHEQLQKMLRAHSSKSSRGGQRDLWNPATSSSSSSSASTNNNSRRRVGALENLVELCIGSELSDQLHRGGAKLFVPPSVIALSFAGNGDSAALWQRRGFEQLFASGLEEAFLQQSSSASSALKHTSSNGDNLMWHGRRYRPVAAFVRGERLASAKAAATQAQAEEPTLPDSATLAQSSVALVASPHKDDWPVLVFEKGSKRLCAEMYRAPVRNNVIGAHASGNNDGDITCKQRTFFFSIVYVIFFQPISNL